MLYHPSRDVAKGYQIQMPVQAEGVSRWTDAALGISEQEIDSGLPWPLAGDSPPILVAIL